MALSEHLGEIPQNLMVCHHIPHGHHIFWWVNPQISGTNMVTGDLWNLNWGNIPAKYGLIWYSTSILGS